MALPCGSTYYLEMIKEGSNYICRREKILCFVLKIINPWLIVTEENIELLSPYFSLIGIRIDVAFHIVIQNAYYFMTMNISDSWNHSMVWMEGTLVMI